MSLLYTSYTVHNLALFLFPASYEMCMNDWTNTTSMLIEDVDNVSWNDKIISDHMFVLSRIYDS